MSIALLGLLTCYSNLYTDVKWVRDVEIREQDVVLSRLVGRAGDHTASERGK